MQHPSTSTLDVVIMAAGKGTRMKSAIPKVLQRLGGEPLLGHVMALAQSLQPRSRVVICGHGHEQVNTWLQQGLQNPVSAASAPVKTVLQEPQLGTGHALMQAVPVLPNDGHVLVLSGDVPLTQTHVLQAFLDAVAGSALGLLTVHMNNPTGYGRIVRTANGQSVQAIVEHKDATEAQRAITEVYSGVMCVRTADLKRWLNMLDNRNAQGEYYLTDIVKHAVSEGLSVQANCIDDALQVAGVNNPAQLAELERAYQGRVAQTLMEHGVRLADPARIDVRGTLNCGHDVEVDVNCVFEGQVTLEDGVRIGPHCVIRHAHIQAGSRIEAFTHMDGTGSPVQVGPHAQVGPFARLRPGAQLGADVHIGNFVEVKNSTLAAGAKANHLAYLGDATVGERVNYGAGSITANYDGANKHRTVIGADVHVGSNSVLVAPVQLGAGGTIGAGSTVTRDTPEGALTVTRAKTLHIVNWQRPVKKKSSP